MQGFKCSRWEAETPDSFFTHAGKLMCGKELAACSCVVVCLIRKPAVLECFFPESTCEGFSSKGHLLTSSSNIISIIIATITSSSSSLSSYIRHHTSINHAIGNHLRKTLLTLRLDFFISFFLLSRRRAGPAGAHETKPDPLRGSCASSAQTCGETSIAFMPEQPYAGMVGVDT